MKANIIQKIAKEIIKIAVTDWAEDWQIELGNALSGTGGWKEKFNAWVKSNTKFKTKYGDWDTIGFKTILKDNTEIVSVLRVDSQGKSWRSHWDVRINGKDISREITRRGMLTALENALDEILMKGLDKWKKEVQRIDWTAGFSDDYSVTLGAERHKREVQQLYEGLNDAEKRIAFAFYKTLDIPKDYKYKSVFTSFKGV